MAVTPETFKSRDISDASIWTHEGGATFEAGPFQSGTVLIGDGSNDNAYSDNGFADASGAILTIGTWFRSNNAPGANEVVLAQRDADAGAPAVFNIEVNPTGLLTCAFFDTTTANQVFSQTKEGVADNLYRYLTVTVDQNDVNIHINSFEGLYTLQDSVSGGGFTNGVNYSGTLNLGVGAMSPETTVAGRRFFDGNVGGISLWQGTKLTQDEIDENFINQIAIVTAKQSLFPDISLFPV